MKVLDPTARWLARPWVHGPLAVGVLYAMAWRFGPNSYLTFLMTISLIYGISALGLNIPSGFLGLFSLSQGAAFAVGAYSVAILTTTFGWPALSALPAAMAVGAAIGIVMGAPAARLDKLGLGMISLGFTIIMFDFSLGLPFAGGEGGIVISSPTLLPGGDIVDQSAVFMVVLMVGLAVYVAHWYLRLSHFGRVSLAIKAEELGAVALGANPYLYKVIGWSAGSAVGALAGGLYAYVERVVTPDTFPVDLSILFLLMVVLGGPGTRVGPILGALVIGIVPILLSRYPGYNIYVYGVLLILLMRLLPGGLYSKTTAPVRLPASFNHSPDPSSRSEPKDAVVLSLRDVVRDFGGVRALDNVTVDVATGQILAIVGPNGSGKTTMLNVISGFYTPNSGLVEIAGENINGRSPHAVARLGVARTFQTSKVFPNLSIEEHIALAVSYGKDKWGEGLALDFLRAVGLGPSTWYRQVTTLGHGNRRFLELAMVAFRSPDLVLLDEPASGLSAVQIERLMGLVHQLARGGAAVLLVEHHLDVVRRVAPAVAVMHLGKLIWRGEPNRLHESAAVREAYLGVR